MKVGRRSDHSFSNPSLVAWAARGMFLIGVWFIGHEPKYPETGPLVDGVPSKSKSINHAFVGDLGYFMHHRAKVHNALGFCSVLVTFTVSNSARFLAFTVCLIRCRSTAGWVGLALSRNFVSFPSYKYERMEFTLLHSKESS